MMKHNASAGSTRLLHRFVAALLSLALLAAVAVPVLADGEEAVEGEIIYINSVSDLEAFAKKCSYDAWSKNKTVVLQEDLELEGEWAPIPSFSGAFLGNGHTISGVKITGAYAPAGFFSIVEEGGSVRDLTIKGLVEPADTQRMAGGIVGRNYGVLIGCTFSGAVVCEKEVGGIAGRNETSGTIDHAYARAVVTGTYQTGGIVGYNLGTITGCTNVGAVNAEYQDAGLDMEGFPASLLEYVKQDMGADLSNSISNVASDTGGIAGRSSGLLLSCANTGSIGYAHVGYNVGGIAGRTDGLISGCVNQGYIQGRKDVGGIAGQAEPYINLDLDESTLHKLRTELSTLHDMVNGAANDMDNSSGTLNQDLNQLNAHMTNAIDAARRLEDQGRDYLDDVADEVDRTGELFSDTMTRLEPVMDTAADSLDKMTDSVGQLKWVTAEMAAEMLTASTALAKASSGMATTSDAMDTTKKGLQQIGDGLEELLKSIEGGDDTQLTRAINAITGGYSLLSDNDIDDKIQTAVGLLQIANTAMSVLSMGSGVSGQMKLLATGLGLMRSAALLSNDSDFFNASRQVSRAVSNLASVSGAVSGLLKTTSQALEANGNTKWGKALSTVAEPLNRYDDVFQQITDFLDKLDDLDISGAGTVKDGLNTLSDATKQLGDAFTDFEKSLSILQTDSALTSATLGHLSVAMGMMHEGMKGLTDTTSQAADIVHWLAEQDPIHMPRPTDEMGDTTDELFDAMTSMTDQMSVLNRDALSASNTLTGNIRQINDQINVVTSLLLDTVEEISDPGSKNVFEDQSEELVAQNEGKLEGCTNRGTVEADMNVGGIAGTMAVENTLDPEDDDKNNNQSLLRTEYTISAVVLHCTNEGSVEAKKEAVGGIVGGMDLGFVSGCESYGDVEGTNKVGGIAGTSSAKLLSNWAKCAITGKKYVGGIVGQGTDGLLTGNSCVAKENRAIVDIRADSGKKDDDDNSGIASGNTDTNTQYWGAISGGQDGEFVGNLFVSDTLAGIDRVSRAGQAEPTTFEAIRALEGAPAGFQKLTLTFTADGHVIERRTVAYGDSFTQADYPELPQKDGFYAEWSTPVVDNIHLDTTVRAVYTAYTPALTSSETRDNGRTIFLVEGLFGGSNALKVTAQEPTGDLGGVTEQWLLEFSDDGQAEHTIRYLTPGEGSVYVRQADGSWQKAETGSFGSYTTFTVEGTQAVVAFVPKHLPIWAICLGGAAALLVLAFLLKKGKARRTARKAAKAAALSEGSGTETSDTDELETPLQGDEENEKTMK